MDSNIPFYMQIKNYLKQKILMNELSPGDLIPSERELTEKFKMSRSTIRKAINELVYEGYLLKVQGKGTFVAKYELEKDLYKITELKSRQKDSIQIDYRTIDERILVDINTDTPQVVKENFKNKLYYLERLILVDEKNVGIQKIWSYPEYVNQIAATSLDQLETIGTEFYEEISISYAGKEDARLLEVKNKKPLLKNVQMISRDQPIIYVINLFDSNKVKISKKVSFKKGGASQIR